MNNLYCISNLCCGLIVSCIKSMNIPNSVIVLSSRIMVGANFPIRLFKAKVKLKWAH